MRGIATSDWHGDSVTYGVPRFEDVRRAVLDSIACAGKVGADFYAFLGDLCDPDDGPSVLKCTMLAGEAVGALHRLGIPSFWLAGNHDVVEDGSGVTTLSPLRSFGLPVRVLERPELFSLGPIDVLALPFTASSHPYDVTTQVRKAVETQSRRPLLVLSHLAVEGIQPGEETTDMPRGREVKLPLEELAKLHGRVTVLSGHYHRGQVFRAKECPHPIHVVGSIARLTFSEEKNTPRFLEVNL